MGAARVVPANAESVAQATLAVNRRKAAAGSRQGCPLPPLGPSQRGAASAAAPHSLDPDVERADHLAPALTVRGDEAAQLLGRGGARLSGLHAEQFLHRWGTHPSAVASAIRCTASDGMRAGPISVNQLPPPTSTLSSRSVGTFGSREMRCAAETASTFTPLSRAAASAPSTVRNIESTCPDITTVIPGAWPVKGTRSISRLAASARVLRTVATPLRRGGGGGASVGGVALRACAAQARARRRAARESCGVDGAAAASPAALSSADRRGLARRRRSVSGGLGNAGRSGAGRRCSIPRLARRRAGGARGQSPGAEAASDVAGKLFRHVANLMRAITDMLAAPDRRRGKAGQQVVRIERVNVEAGAQAIVGAVAAPAAGGRDEAGPWGEGLVADRAKDPMGSERRGACGMATRQGISARCRAAAPARVPARRAPCRGPAMTNGRRRMHGGWSTGPCTPEGLARLCAARTRHGGRPAETVKFLRRFANRGAAPKVHACAPGRRARRAPGA